MTRRAVLDRNQLLMERAESAAARQVAAAYNQARRELLQTLLSGWTGRDVLTPDQAVDLLRRLGLLVQIDGRLAQLGQELGVILRDVMVAGEERAVEAIAREMALLPVSLRSGLRQFTGVNFPMIERFLPIALSEASLGTAALRSQLQRELQVGLLQGESFPSLVHRLMATAEPSVFRNGRTSAERATRRLVVHAENAARQDLIQQVRTDVPEVRKQAVAVIQGRTTETCLHVHGQIVDVDKPFDLGGYQPQFAQKMMHTPFHWHCRTSITMWHPRFEQGGLNTANMMSSARAELRKRRST